MCWCLKVLEAYVSKWFTWAQSWGELLHDQIERQELLILQLSEEANVAESKPSAHPRICMCTRSNCYTEEMRKRTHCAVYSTAIYIWKTGSCGREREEKREMKMEGNKEREGENSERLSTSCLVVISISHLAKHTHTAPYNDLSLPLFLSPSLSLLWSTERLIQNDKTAHSSGDKFQFWAVEQWSCLFAMHQLLSISLGSIHFTVHLPCNPVLSYSLLRFPTLS